MVEYKHKRLQMLFVSLTSHQVADYSYACTRLQNALLKMRKARKVLEDIAGSCDNKSLMKCIHLFISESVQFENEISAQMNSFNCMQFHKHIPQNVKKSNKTFMPDNIEHVCSYLEENYINSHRRLLKDKYLNNSLKSLINNQLRSFLSSITQMRLLNEVEPDISVHPALH